MVQKDCTGSRLPNRIHLYMRRCIIPAMETEAGPATIVDRMKIRYLEEYQRSPVVTAFLTGMFVMILVSLVCALVTDGNTFRYMLHPNESYIFMDHFSITVTCYDHPYTNGDFNIYPPLAVLMYGAIAHFTMPYTTIMEDNWHTAMEMRVHEVPIMVLMLLIIGLIFLTYVMYQKYTGKEFTTRSFNLVFFTILFSYPVVWGLSVCNCIFLAAFCAALYVFLYDSDNKWVRYFAYIMLGVSAGMKLIPAFLGILTLKHRGLTEFIKCVVIVSALIFVPFLFTDGDPIDILTRSMEYSKDVPSTFGILNINDLTKAIGLDSTISLFLKLLLTGIVLLTVLFDDKMERWEEVTLISSLLILAFSVSVPYLFIYMLVGMMIFLATRKQMDRKSMIAVVCFVVIFCVIPGFYFNPPYIATVKSLFLFILVAYLVYCSLSQNILKGGNKEPTKEEGSRFKLKGRKKADSA